MKIINLQKNEILLLDGLTIKTTNNYNYDYNTAYDKLDDIIINIDENATLAPYKLSSEGNRISIFNRVKISQLYESDLYQLFFFKPRRHTSSMRYIIDEGIFSYIMRSSVIDSILS